jgi:hypothetical protein
MFARHLQQKPSGCALLLSESKEPGNSEWRGYDPNVCVFRSHDRPALSIGTLVGNSSRVL